MAKKQYTKKRMTFGSAVATAGKALYVANQVKKLINVEIKSYDNPLVSGAPTVTGLSHRITNMAEGDDYNLRNGRSIKLKSIRLYGLATLNPAATSSTVRVIIVRALQEVAGSIPAASSVFGSAQFINSMPNPVPSTKSQFQILWDKTFLLEGGVASTKRVQYYKKLNHHVTFSGTAVDTESKGAYFLYVVSDNSANAPDVDINCRVRYIDN